MEFPSENYIDTIDIGYEVSFPESGRVVIFRDDSLSDSVPENYECYSVVVTDVEPATSAFVASTNKSDDLLNALVASGASYRVCFALPFIIFISVVFFLSSILLCFHF